MTSSHALKPDASRAFLTYIFTGVVAAGFLLSLPMAGVLARAATPTRIVFVARIDNVYDPGEALQDTIQVDELLRGTIT